MFTVHSIIGSPFGRAVLATLIEKDAPYRIQALGPGAHRGPEHIARHPFGRVPAIDHDGFQLYETQAILRYIDRVFPNPPLTPADPKAAARMDQVMNANDRYLFRVVGVPVIFNRVVAPKLGFPGNDEAVVAALPEARACVAAMDTLLGDAPFVAGETLTLADLHLFPHVDMMTECAEGREMLAGTKLAAWHERLATRPCFQRTSWDALLEAA